MHDWDFTTPDGDTLRGMDDLTRQAQSTTSRCPVPPSWPISRRQTIADLRGWAPLVALQVEYGLVERDLLPMAREMGLCAVPSSPLAGDVLTGKYTRADQTAAEPVPARAATSLSAGSPNATSASPGSWPTSPGKSAAPPPRPGSPGRCGTPP
ncbi:Aldo/keto reductase family protein [Amycolatopsis rubida]|uniref:Aldo/keto reductase family protein n=1 Tax=Amycolatopsis rubida TaxID=112413 RepID=A0A1I6A1L9_9PSEU|nr:Aldo/keto reductase family protein [Amycolatopsis rubida]